MKKDEFGTEAFEQIVDSLWANREQLADQDYYFDCPNYGGIPAKIANRLSSDAVDVIQEIYTPYVMKDVRRKATLRNLLRDSLFLLS